jgi:hypothetical protein
MINRGSDGEVVGHLLLRLSARGPGFAGRGKIASRCPRVSCLPKTAPGRPKDNISLISAMRQAKSPPPLPPGYSLPRQIQVLGLRLAYRLERTSPAMVPKIKIKNRKSKIENGGGAKILLHHQVIPMYHLIPIHVSADTLLLLLKFFVVLRVLRVFVLKFGCDRQPRRASSSTSEFSLHPSAFTLHPSTTRSSRCITSSQYVSTFSNRANSPLLCPLITSTSARE